ncbi:glycoside hydrolase family 76 protein [Pedobacter deserti]|uniref:glycoside hydrolase family 76 protein n=1 Tax=Pedobacter deserti TaxID=2817382 RepID=UPI00210EFBB6|nr:glycoside hydrolase family 76 protein [Pedobacter sp. SYSU D00382]
MKHIYILWVALVLSATILSCKKGGVAPLPEDNIGTTISPVAQLKAQATTEENELALSWTNPEDEHLMKVEISYSPTATPTAASPNPVLVDAASGAQATLKIKLPVHAKYTIRAVTINRAGVRSVPATVEATPFKPGTVVEPEPEDLANRFLKRTDTLMTSLVAHFLEGKYMDMWTNDYPYQVGDFWQNAAMAWGHGAAFSGYAAFKEAAEGKTDYKTKIQNLYDNRLLTSIDKLRNRKNGKAEAYAVWPGDTDERFYDDNIWIGIDMADLYMLTKNQKYLDRAEMVWTFVLEGTDNAMGGGVYWKEYGDSKNTCSTAPAAVLAAKLYEATKKPAYLNSAKSLYSWVKQHLQDPSDYLYWDNVKLSDKNNPNSALLVDKSKFSYNSGQPMQAAALLYNITNEQQYLTDAQNIAKSAYKRWFIPFNSYTIGQSFRILAPDHVWFQAIMFRGFVELYKIDKNRAYVSAYEKTMENAWRSNARNRGTNMINDDFRGGTTQTSWEILFQGACLEMLARLAALEQQGL